MATSNLLTTQFDDSEDEDDNFNPAPADLSDDENLRGNNDESEAQVRSEGARRRVAEDTYDDDDDEDVPPARINGKSKTPDRRGADVADEDGEDDEGEGEDLNGEAGDEEEEEEEDEEDDDEEEVTVRYTSEVFL
jgi:transcription elongation factor SPT5